MGDHQAPAQGVKRAVGIGVAEGEPVGEKRERERKGVAGGFGGVDQTVRGGHRLVTATGDHQATTRAARMSAWVSRPRASWARHHSTAPFGLADGQVRTAKQALDAVRHRRGSCRDASGRRRVADSRLDPSGQAALRRDHIQEREPGMVDGAGGFDQLFGPGYRLVILDHRCRGTAA